jgi:C-terminal processing protease CtpA/Prc
LWARNPDNNFWFERLSEDAAYVNWRSYDGLKDNVAKLLGVLELRRPARLIIDLRSNGGGDFEEGRFFIREIVERPWLNQKGRLFVLIGRNTFSAAMTNAVDFKRMTQATLVGEPAGAAPNNWQEVRSFNLPHSGLAVTVSTKYYSFLPGADAVRPDITVPPAIADWSKGYDAAVRHILERSPTK